MKQDKESRGVVADIIITDMVKYYSLLVINA